jgi:site-specific DNA-methyltransferase (adenine-specific)
MVSRLRQYVPDILDCLAQLSNDEVPTPPKLARAMLDILPADIWSNPDLKWLDPFCKSGVFLREIAVRLLEGLSDWEPEFYRRREHIYRDMLFGTSITEMTGVISRRTLYCSRDASGDRSIVRFDDQAGSLPFIRAKHEFIAGTCRLCQAPEDLERGEERENYAYSFIHGASQSKEMADMKFDVIVGNPPYQIGTEGYGATASTVYHRFVTTAIEHDPRFVLMITPSRWFTGGKGLDQFRERMIADRRLRTIVDNPRLFDCFPGVEIKGGVSYFLWDRQHDGDCEFSTRISGQIVSTALRDLRDGDGVLVRDNRAMSVIEKAGRVGERLEGVCSVRKPFGLTIFSNYPGSVPEPFEGAVPLIYSNRVGYSRPDQIQRNHHWIDRWKVLIPKAGDGHGREVSYVLGEPIALAPGSACTQTYLIAGMFDTAAETENYAHYLATKFVRFLVLQRKATMDVTPDRFRFVPLLDMTRSWTDVDLYDHFGLTSDERDYIEATIHPRLVNLSLDSPIPASHLPGGNKHSAKGTANDLDDEDDSG